MSDFSHLHVRCGPYLRKSERKAEKNRIAGRHVCDRDLRFVADSVDPAVLRNRQVVRRTKKDGHDGLPNCCVRFLRRTQIEIDRIEQRRLIQIRQDCGQSAPMPPQLIARRRCASHGEYLEGRFIV